MEEVGEALSLTLRLILGLNFVGQESCRDWMFLWATLVHCYPDAD